MAKRAGKKAKRAQIDPTRGWVPIREKLKAVPLRLPELQSLQVVFGRNGDGHTAARHFVRQHLSQLRYHNPDADIFQRNSKAEERARVTVQLADSDPVELDVTGLPHRSDVLRKVLEATKMGAAEVDAAIVAACAMREVTIDATGYCGDAPAKTHGVRPRVVQPPPKKAAEQ